MLYKWISESKNIHISMDTCLFTQDLGAYAVVSMHHERIYIYGRTIVEVLHTVDGNYSHRRHGDGILHRILSQIHARTRLSVIPGALV